MLEIYLTDLQAYNEGNLVGKWIQLPLTPMELSQAVSEVLTEGETISGTQDHEEYFITDWEWCNHEFGTIDEYQNIYQINESLQLIDDKSDYELKIISFLIHQEFAADIEKALDKVDDVTIYENQTMEDVAYDLMQELYQADLLPSIIANNIDYESIARDLEYDGTYYEDALDVYQYIG